jgi:hypothetical protein
VKTPKYPAPPGPKETASAQTGTNVSTAVANAWLQNPNQVTPDGTFTQTQTGTRSWVDPSTGATYNIPVFTQTQALSEAQQAIKDQSDAAELNLASIANDQSGFLRGYLNKPFDGSNEATEARLMELGRKRLDPVLAERDESLRTRLANQGIKAGSQAYDREMRNNWQSDNDAYNNLILSGRQQAFSEAQAERNQPINEIGALLGTGQVSQPQFMNPNIGAMPTTDYAGLVNQNYNQRLNAWQQQQSSRNSMLGGLLGFGGSALSAGLPMLSDKRAKENIKPVGTLKGHKLYEYDYKPETGIPGKHIGVMAQEVEKKRPDAVAKGQDGYRRVNYGTLFGRAS